ncbi:MAG: FAD-dependent thymidylate synthase, partial [Firmicutes bacterium]|nr:FAD-dependent thymidylate synthase [Bacillota bacterium]
MKVTAKAQLVRFTENPEQTIALAAKLCYSEDSLLELTEKMGQADCAKLIKALKKMGHLSTYEHASFTFALSGVSRALLAQITRHRIASFSVRSQRYVSHDSFHYIIPPSIEALGKEAVK